MTITVQKTIDTLTILKKVARHYDASYAACIARFLRLYLADRFRRDEIFRLGIANPATPREVMEEVLSPRRATQM